MAALRSAGQSSWVAWVCLGLAACQCRPATSGARDAAVSLAPVDAGAKAPVEAWAPVGSAVPQWRAVAAAVERGDEAPLNLVTALLRQAGVDTGEEVPTTPRWTCASDALGWWCTSELRTQQGLSVEPTPGDDLGERTVVRAGRWVDGGVVVHEWPQRWEPGAEESPGADCARGCDEGGDPMPSAQADQPAGSGTGACYASCTRALERQNAGLWWRERTVTFVTRVGAERLVFHEQTHWARAAREDELNPEAEPADPPGEEEPGGSAEAYLVLRLPEDDAPPLQLESTAASFEGTGPGYVLGWPDGGSVVLAARPDGGLARGADACALLDGLGLHRRECGDGGAR